MSKRVAFVHTTTAVVPTFRELAQELFPQAEVAHLVDETLLKDVLASGEITPGVHRRLINLFISAEAWGAELVVLTCSSVSPVADVADSLVGVPVLKIDEAMADQAVMQGDRIGVLATAYTTLEPTRKLILSRAEAQGRDVEVRIHLCEKAYDALLSGDRELHDRLVLDCLNQLLQQVDVVVLAQASMARVVEELPAEARTKPILTSPRPGVERARARLEQPQ